MENASKALIIAGGVMLSMLLFSLLIYTINTISSYKANSQNLADISDIAEFNLQFTRYDRKDVLGYELISLFNKIADYNNRFSDAEGAKNDKKESPIIIKINFNNKLEDFAFSESNELYLFNKSRDNIITNDEAKIRNRIEEIFNQATTIEDSFGGLKYSEKIAKSINSIILKPEQLESNENNKGWTQEQSKKIAVQTFNSLTNGEKYNDEDYDKMKTDLTGNKGKNILAYYEYYQFKKAKFECTNILYNDNTGKVKSIEFKLSS